MTEFFHDQSLYRTRNASQRKSLLPPRFFEIKRRTRRRYGPVSSQSGLVPMSYLQAIPRRHLLTIGKALVSAAAIVFILSRFDLPFFLSHWHKLNAPPVAMSLAVLALETTLVAGM